MVILLLDVRQPVSDALGYIGRFVHRWDSYWSVGIKGKMFKEGKLGFQLVVGVK